MKSVLWVVLVYGLFTVGCERRLVSLQAEIAARPPDEWNFMPNEGATSNNYAILRRVMELPDDQDRIRMARLLRDHFRRTPEWSVTNGLATNAQWFAEMREERRWRFLRNCAHGLITGTNATPETVRAGWRMNAEFIDDWEKMIALTEPALHGGKPVDPRDEKARIGQQMARFVRRQYELYFTYCFAAREDCLKLPFEERPAFVEQIKRDFFWRKGMAFVDRRDIAELEAEGK